MHAYAALAGHLAHDLAHDSDAHSTHEQENEPNGGRHAQQHTGHKSETATRSSSRSPTAAAAPASPFPPMAPEEDSGRGESREYPERGGEAAYDEPSRAYTQAPPPLSRSASQRSDFSTTDSKISASSSSLGEVDPSKVYVENLPLPISETQLRDLFQQFGGITRIHIGTDRMTKAQLGFAFVEFAQDQQGLNAIAAMHQREVNGKFIRCSQAKRRPAPNAPPSAPVSAPVSAPAMWQTSQPLLGATGTAVSQPMNAGQAMMGGASMDVHGMQQAQQQPQPYFMMMNPALGGMGMMPQQMAAGTAGMMMQTPMGMMPMMMMMPTTVASTPAATPTPAAAQPASGRHDAPASPNVFINGIPFAYTESDLKSLFEAFGTIVSVKILLDPSGKSKGQGFVHFDNQISAQASIQAWNGKKPPHGETYLQVRFALPRKKGAIAGATPQQQPSTAPAEPLLQFAASHGVAGAASGGGSEGYGPDRKARAHLGQKYDPLVRSAQPPAASTASTLSAAPSAPAVTASPSLTANGPDSTTLFIYHVPKGLTNEELQTLFSQHGGVISVSIPRDSNNQNKGFAFAKMQTMADAHNAMNALQGHEIQGKRLKVSFKTERPAATGIVLPPGSVASNTAALIAQAQAQAVQQQQQAAAAAQQHQMMMMNPMMGGMMYNPAMVMGGGAIMPQQQQQQMQMMQMQQTQQMQQPGGAGAMMGQMQPGMLQPMTGGYGMQAGQMQRGASGGGEPAQHAAQGIMAGGYGMQPMQHMYQPMHMQPQQQQTQQQPYYPQHGLPLPPHAHSQPQ